MKRLFILSFGFLILLPVILTTQSCPSGFKLVNKNKCLKIFSQYDKHYEAESDCRGYGGTLATAHNAIDNRAIVSFAGNAALAYIWMGMFCFGNQSSTCYHDDGSGVVKYNNFAPGNPVVDSTVRDGGCVYTPAFGNDAGKWYSGPCEWTGIEYVCEVPVTKNDTCTYNYNGNCYFPSNLLPIPDVDRDFFDALNICHTHSMELLSIHSRREIDYIKSIYKDSGIVELTLGAQAIQKNLFDWTDGTNFDYDNFDPLSTTNGSCLQMDLSERDDIGMWYQTDCLTVKYFMCYKPAGSAPGVVEIDTKEKKIHPKFQATRFAPPKVLDLSDSSNCNTTLLLAPGVITSLGYSNNKALIAYCFWKVAVLGPYRLGLYFTDFSVKNPVNVYSDNNTLLNSFDDNKTPFSLLAPSNLVTLTHDSANDGLNDYHGFSATVLPY